MNQHLPKILNFYPSKDKNSNMLGFATIEIVWSIGDNIFIPAPTKVKVMRNSNNGHIFFAMHSEAYTAKDGTTKYSHIIFLEKEKNELFQKQARRAWDTYTKEQTMKPEEETKQQYYPHGLAQNNQPVQAIEEVPF